LCEDFNAFYYPPEYKRREKNKNKNGKKIIIKKIKKIVKANTNANVRKTNNKIRLTVSITPKKNIITAANAVIIEKESNNVKIKNVKTKIKLFKTKVIIRLRRYLILNLIDFYSRKLKVIKFIKILLRVRWVISTRITIK